MPLQRARQRIERIELITRIHEVRARQACPYIGEITNWTNYTNSRSEGKTSMPQQRARQRIERITRIHEVRARQACPTTNETTNWTNYTNSIGHSTLNTHQTLVSHGDITLFFPSWTAKREDRDEENAPRRKSDWPRRSVDGFKYLTNTVSLAVSPYLWNAVQRYCFFLIFLLF